MHLVFVYGTLKQGFNNYRFLQPRIPTKAIAPGFDLHSGPGYPFAIRGKGIIEGEVYEVDDETLKRLDRLEGVPSLYQRIKTKVISNNTQVECWIYVSHLAERFPKIDLGIWK